ncbi:MAG: MarR family transcriptional regulator [Maritimibacter sp.]|nr:MarR family transcriptional regulator [Maritimibacter sp.]
MNPSDRLLRVMEYLMLAGQEPVKQVDIARDLDISPATLNRIIKVLSDRGYVFRTSERFVVPNFRFTKNVPMSVSYLEVLDEVMEGITAEHGVFSEAVVVTGQDLYWHSRTELDPMPVAIRAKAGFRRPLYELDAMSRLYLGRLGEEQVEYQFNIRSFHDNSPALAPYAPETAKELIAQAAEKDFDWDFDGNRVGLRRFAIVIDDLDGNFLHFLTMAEAADPVANPEERIETCRNVLEEARAGLVAAMEKENRQADIDRRAKITRVA